MSIIVIDLETTGLDTNTAKITEVAAMNLYDAERKLYFVPFHEWLYPTIDGEGLMISRYFERGLYTQMLTFSDTREQYINLWKMLEGNTVAGSNPRFDTNLLARQFASMGLRPEPWHHRLLDLSAYATGVLGLDLDQMPGLASVCPWVNVEHTQQHSAMGDVEVTRECFLRLARFRSELKW